MAMILRRLSLRGSSKSVDSVTAFSDAGDSQQRTEDSAVQEDGEKVERKSSLRRRSFSKKLVRSMSSISTASELLTDDTATSESEPQPQSLPTSPTSSFAAGTLGTGSQIIRRTGSMAEFAQYYQVIDIVSSELKMVTSESSVDPQSARIIDKSERSREDIEKEIETLRSLDHQSISKLFEVFEDPLRITFIMEGCNLGTLSGALKEHSWSEKMAGRTMKQLMRAVKFMHDRRISHRALQPDVIRLENRGKGIQDCKAQVGDLQHAQSVRGDGKMKGNVGHVLYSAPQMLLGQTYTKLCDVWSCGALLHTMVCGVAPYEHEHVVMEHPSSTASDNDFWNKVDSGDLPTQLWKDVSSSGKGILKNMLSRKEPDRWSIPECLANKWLEFFGTSATSDSDLTVQHLESLVAFCGMNKLQKLALQVISRRMSDVESQPLREVFETLDSANDGVLDSTEFAAALKKVRNQSDKQSWRLRKALEAYPTAKEFMTALDTNGNGELDLTEFLAAATPRKKYGGQNNKLLQVAFNTLDADGSGEISLAEFEEVLLERGRSTEAERREIRELLKNADSSGNGELDFQEFTEMMEATSEKLLGPSRPQTAPSFWSASTTPSSPMSPNAQPTSARLSASGILRSSSGKISVNGDRPSTSNSGRLSALVSSNTSTPTGRRRHSAFSVFASE